MRSAVLGADFNVVQADTFNVDFRCCWGRMGWTCPERMCFMKLTLRKKRYIIMAVGIVSLIVLVLSELSDVNWLFFWGFLGFIVMFALDFAWLRCPHCGEWLGKYPGDYCKNCGEKLDWK